jgi:hypothetical protein
VNSISWGNDSDISDEDQPDESSVIGADLNQDDDSSDG